MRVRSFVRSVRGLHRGVVAGEGTLQVFACAPPDVAVAQRVSQVGHDRAVLRRLRLRSARKTLETVDGKLKVRETTVGGILVLQHDPKLDHGIHGGVRFEATQCQGLARQLPDAIACRRGAADRVAPIEEDGELGKSRDARLVADRARIQRSLSARDRAIEMGGLL